MNWTGDDVRALIQNPFYAITIDPTLSLPHEPLISREEWVQANARLIDELGPVTYLRGLLDVLEGGWVASGAPGPGQRPQRPSTPIPPKRGRNRKHR